jgi:hypothetical protein
MSTTLAVDTDKIAVLRRARRVWAIASVHGEVDRLVGIHREIARRFVTGDRLVYLGNVIGRGGDAIAAIDALLAFRRAVIGANGMFANDVAILRGAQEEMWQKLLQLQLALDPGAVLEWMLDHGVAATLEAYGGDTTDGMRAARGGAAACARWTSALRDAIQRHPGHNALFSALRRAAVSEPAPATAEVPEGAPLLFVHAGLDVSRPLATQKDSFWWSTGRFNDIDKPYGDFARVVRGYDNSHAGIVSGPYTLSIDTGCGFGGPLTAVCLDGKGTIVEQLEA